MSLVSVIIPCFNAQAYIADAIESALRQTYEPLEVIVVDDGSTDDSLSVIRSYEHDIHFETGPNKGACAARNTGLAMARGDFIQFLDADDLLHPEKVERQLQVLRETERSVVYCLQDVVSLEPGSAPAVVWNRHDECEDPVVFMLRGDVQTSAALHRKELLIEIGGFREDLPCAQDRDLHLRLAMAGVHFRLLPEVLQTIRRRTSSVSSDVLEVSVQRGRIAEWVFEQLDASDQLTELRRVECAAMMMRASRVLYRYGNSSLGETFNRRAFEMHPSGGVHLAYSRKARLLRRVLSPNIFEACVGWKRLIPSS